MLKCSAATAFSRALAPLRPLAGGEGGARRGCAGRVRWVAAVRDGGSPHLTPTLSAPEGGEGDIPAVCRELLPGLLGVSTEWRITMDFALQPNTAAGARFVALAEQHAADFATRADLQEY